MDLDVVERLVEWSFTHPRGLQHLDAVVVAQEARFFATGAQGVSYFGGFPMGVHVDHGCFLHRLSGSLTLRRRTANDDCQDQSMATTGQGRCRPATV
jgi:hypothetical protein